MGTGMGTGMATVYRAILLAVLLTACADEKSAKIPVKKTVEIPVVVDETAPSTSLANTPFALTNQSTASFTFSGKDDTALDRFACRIDAGGWKTCTSPKNIVSLAAGTHRFEVKAIDTAGNEDATPAAWAWTVDLTPPDTTIQAGPAAFTSATSAWFVFNGTDSIAIRLYECRLDAGPWATCESPKHYPVLLAAAHTFEVRSIDTASNVDPAPAAYGWTVDLTPPDTQLTAWPASVTDSATAAFSFSATDIVSVSGFECNRDGLGWNACNSPVTYSSLATGPHSFQVRAHDASGNVDASPAGANWTILLSYPSDPAACFTGGETPQLDLTGPDLGWTWNDPHVLKVGAEYWMYASATYLFNFPVRMYRLTSSDGIQWARNPTEPVLTDAAPGAFDAGGLETPAVVFFQGQYHLFYTTYKYDINDPLFSVYDMRIGHAVSNDGITFSRSSTEPVVSPSGTDGDPGNDWYAFIVGEPGPVVFNGELFLYFTTVGADAALGTSLQVIGVIRSTDGINWSAPELALKPDQTLYPRNQDWIGYSTPNAMVLNGAMHLFFDVAHQPPAGNWLQLRLHHASSPDGLTQWVQDAQAIRSAGDFVWAVNEIRSPDAFLDGSTLRLYFAGHELDGNNPEYFSVGMMSCDLTPQ